MAHPRPKARLLAALALLSLPPGGALLTAAEQAASGPVGGSGELPLELAYSRRDFLPFEAPVVSSAGVVAYSERAPRPGAPSLAGPFLASGAPNWALGAAVVIVDPAAGEKRAVCPAEVNCWRPSWSPEGRRLAFFTDREGFPQVWLYELETARTRPLSAARVRPKQWSGDRVRWSPDGGTVYAALDPASWGEGARPPAEPAPARSTPPAPPPEGGTATVIVHGSGSEAPPPAESGPGPAARDAFLARRHGAILAAIDVGTGEARPVVGVDADPTPAVLRLSPSGRWLGYFSVFRMAAPGPAPLVHDLAVAAVADGRTWTLARDLPVPLLDYWAGDYVWHPAQDRLVFVHDGGLWHVDLRGGEPAPAQRLGGDLPELIARPLAFTRDGGAVLVGVEPVDDHDYLDRRPRRLALVPLDGSAPRRLDLPADARYRDVFRSDARTLWQPEPGAVTLALEDAATGEALTARLDLGVGALTPLRRGHEQLRGSTAGGRHDRLVGQYQDAATPPSVVRFDASCREMEILARVEPRLATVAPVRAEVFTTDVPVHTGELQRVRTTVLLPAAPRRGERLPALVVIYPGADLSTWAGRFGGGDATTIPNLVFTSRGYAVLLPHLPLTPEGGAGEPLRETREALLPQIDRAVELGYVDGARLALVGHSYGAYAAAGVVAGSDRFRAAVAISGAYDLPASYGAMNERGLDGSAAFEHGQFRMGVPPWSDLLRYLANSPYHLLDKIETPVLLVHGDADPDVAESRKLFAGLRRLGRDAQLAVYPGQGHGLGTWTRASAVDAVERVLAFLGRHLASGGER